MLFRSKDSDINKILAHLEWRRKKIQTPLAKNISKNLIVPIDRKVITMIITLTSNMATKGIITENIAIMIARYFNKEQNTKLKEQLNLKYLQKFK